MQIPVIYAYVKGMPLNFDQNQKLGKIHMPSRGNRFSLLVFKGSHLLVIIIDNINNSAFQFLCRKESDPDLCRNTMKYKNTHKRRDAAEIRLHFINNK